MTLPIQARVFRLCGVAVIATLAWGLFSTTPVQAACGDYVNVRGQSTSEPPAGHSRPVTSPNAEPCRCRLPLPNDQSPAPCPGCSAPVTPQSAATPPMPRVADNFAALAAPFSFASACIHAAYPNPDTNLLPRSCSGIFRPPRF